VFSGEKMVWGEGVDRALCKDTERLDAAPKTGGRAGDGRLGGEAGDGTNKTTKLTLDPGALVARDKELSDAGVIRDAVRPDMELGADTLLVSMKNEPTTECNRARHGLSVTNFVSLGTET
jgi:hypothetical protein